MGVGGEGDHLAVPEGTVELGEPGLGVFAAAVEVLVGGGVAGDLAEVFGAVEAGFGVALSVVAFAGGVGDGDGFAVLVGAAGAWDGDQVAPAVGVRAAAALEFEDGQGQGQERGGAGVEEDAFVGTALL
ncbi:MULTISPECIES: hypothetical protein [unclassified Streptomyces]|uniref:hypothetical protein n=1 Tax=unclassified Streptomyces TaxID=2593676 RepID=UPI000DC7B49B|nr:MULTISPECIES: hypothetical protein [unclassified Streptomyces]AWZ08449.1 hypothetical protein DRB89_32025 [Streptomyces sp. ICC4]AWZ13874.1 hypothetical protein DRB96_17990 [Streptomyces sp. ICC1]